jgi:hypothetical protein
VLLNVKAAADPASARDRHAGGSRILIHRSVS